MSKIDIIHYSQQLRSSNKPWMLFVYGQYLLDGNTLVKYSMRDEQWKICTILFKIHGHSISHKSKQFCVCVSLCCFWPNNDLVKSKPKPRLEPYVLYPINQIYIAPCKTIYGIVIKFNNDQKLGHILCFNHV